MRNKFQSFAKLISMGLLGLSLSSCAGTTETSSASNQPSGDLSSDQSRNKLPPKVNVTPKQIREAVNKAANPIAAERALNELLKNKQVTMENVRIGLIRRDNRGVAVFQAVEISSDGTIDFWKSNPAILFQVSKSKEDAIASLSEGEIRKVKCSYVAFDKSTPGNDLSGIVFNFEGFGP